MKQKLLRFLLVDDESSVRSICKSYLEDIEQAVVVGEASTVDQAYELIVACSPDVVLLDIQLGKQTGFDLLLKFPERNFKVVFITAYEQFALRAIKAGAMEYLLKPIGEEEFYEMIEKVFATEGYSFNGQAELMADNYHHRKMDRIALNAHDGYHIIWLKDLLYCSASGNYTTFYLIDGTQVVISKILKEYENLLPTEHFVRVHNSSIVNMDYVKKFTKDHELILVDDTAIGVSVRKKDEVLNWIKGRNTDF